MNDSGGSGGGGAASVAAPLLPLKRKLDGNATNDEQARVAPPLRDRDRERVSADESLRISNEMLRTENRQLRRELAALEAANKALDEQNKQSAQRICDLEDDLALLYRQHKKETERLELAHEATRLNLLQQLEDATKKKNPAANAASSSSLMQETGVKNGEPSTAEVSEVMDMCMAWQQQLQTLSTQLQSKVAAIQEDEVKSVLCDLVEQVDLTSRQELLAAQLHDCDEQQQEMKQFVARLTQEWSDREAFEMAEKKVLEERIQKLEEELQQLRPVLQDKESLCLELQSTLDTVNAAQATTTTELAALQEQFKAITIEMSIKQTSFDALAKELNEMHVQKHEATAAWEAERTQLKLELQSSVQSQGGAEQQLIALQSELTSLREERATLSASLEKQYSVVKDHESTLAQLRRASESVEAKLQSVQAANEDLAQKLETEQAVSQELVRKLEIELAAKLEAVNKLKEEQISKEELVQKLAKEQTAKQELISNLEREKAAEVALLTSLEKEKAIEHELATALEKERSLKQDLALMLDKAQITVQELEFKLDKANASHEQVTTELQSERASSEEASRVHAKQMQELLKEQAASNEMADKYAKLTEAILMKQDAAQEIATKNAELLANESLLRTALAQAHQEKEALLQTHHVVPNAEWARLVKQRQLMESQLHEVEAAATKKIKMLEEHVEKLREQSHQDDSLLLSRNEIAQLVVERQAVEQFLKCYHEAAEQKCRDLMQRLAAVETQCSTYRASISESCSMLRMCSQVDSCDDSLRQTILDAISSLQPSC
ncbi:TPA: hypothetical protein N0F65_004987 [Lagenidium giganteum]|uniref:Uncharacterized protein n=1 Tax=Lagenidium giganteum TaxID=4803 RepID=A0AAV2ZEU9_9STRA|nr:TPA: hypothetical protein N0F65_004987 [Lagenidium giganteum]